MMTILFLQCVQFYHIEIINMKRYVDLYQYAIETIERLEVLSGKEFCEQYIERKGECFYKYQNNKVTSNSHGLNFFENIIKYWDEPESYYKKDSKQRKDIIDYEENFVLILKENKND